MTRIASQVLAFAVLALGCTGLIPADDKKPAASDKIDWGAYVDYSKVVGEVEKVDKGVSFSLKVHELVPQASRNTSMFSCATLERGRAAKIRAALITYKHQNNE